MTPTLTAQPIGHTTPSEWLWVVGVVGLLLAVCAWLVATGARTTISTRLHQTRRAGGRYRQTCGWPAV